MGHVSRRIFDRRIDLDWFQDDQIELTRSNVKKKDFVVKNRPFLEVFWGYRSQIYSASSKNLVVNPFWCAAQDGIKVLSYIRNRVNPEKNPKNSWKTRTTRVFCHFWAREVFNHSENSIIVFSAIFPFREVSSWHTFLRLIFSFRK